jgi:short-subunit dehydrogenase
MIEVNVLGVMWGARAAIEAMRAKGGHLINVSSLSAITPVPGFAIYGATKQAILGFTISLAGELKRAALPIQVSAVCPDVIDTDMIRKVRGSKEASLLFASLKLLTVEEVAGIVLGLVDKPRLVASVPHSRAALAHALRPFPRLSLKVLEPFHWFGERQRRKTTKER